MPINKMIVLKQTRWFKYYFLMLLLLFLIRSYATEDNLNPIVETANNCSQFNKTITAKTEFYLRALSKHLQGDHKGALRDMNYLIECYPKDASYISTRGDIKKDLHDSLGAIQDYNQSLTLDPNMATSYLGRGSAKYDLNDFRGADQDFTKGIALLEAEIENKDPESLIPFLKELLRNAYFQRGIIRVIFNHKNAGCMDLSKSGELGNYDAYDLIQKYCN